MMSKNFWPIFGTILILASAVNAKADPDAGEIIQNVIKRDKELQEHRKGYDYDLDVTREKLNSDLTAKDTTESKSVVVGDKRPDYNTRDNLTPEQEAEKQSKEEPFELLNVIDHFSYSLEGVEDIHGIPCYKIAYKPKPNMPYKNREEKVINAVSGYLWVSQKDYSLMKNTGSLTAPVQVGWIFATLKELEFSHETVQLPNGDWGPQQVTYRFLVEIPFGQIHERHTRKMSNYRASGGEKQADGAKSGPDESGKPEAKDSGAVTSSMSTKH